MQRELICTVAFIRERETKPREARPSRQFHHSRLVENDNSTLMTADLLPKSKTQPHGLIAGPWHPVFVLIVVALNALRAAIFAAHSRAGQGPGRPVMYLRTMLFELLVLAIVVVGVRLRG